MKTMKNKITAVFKKFIDGDFDIEAKEIKVKPEIKSEHKEQSMKERYLIWHDNHGVHSFKTIYAGCSIFVCVTLAVILLYTVSYLPAYGNPLNPANNEVSDRYTEFGLEETGAVNTVAGMILDYRAFDTFGESAVLFVAASIVMMLLKKDEKKRSKHLEDHSRDPIIKHIAQVIVPCLLIFGVYLVLNGHLSPGGGFSGGAVMGAGLILYSSAFGYRKASKVITDKLLRNIVFVSFCFYAVAKGYSFFTGANHIPTGIPLGTAGNIISSGLILPLNIAVGLIVTCTMYSFYALFNKGEI